MNIEEVGEQVTSNKILIEFAVQYWKIKSFYKKDLAAINQVRLFKQTLLPCELVSTTGRGTIECFQ